MRRKARWCYACQGWVETYDRPEPCGFQRIVVCDCGERVTGYEINGFYVSVEVK